MENTPSKSKKIRKGDKVVAIAGNSRGMIGTVQSRQGDRVIVQGLNVRKKHVKRSQEAPKGRIVEIERPIHVSNLKVCVEGETAAKLKVRTNEQGHRQFVYNKGDQEVVYRSVKKPK
ncbi:50S ribosomal protein L24 [Candidatus Protochlamydia phocaeensis]|uniref:50S ribosomal protein L24 n=1 Tax=Candidatus Protochlamydia phocaeensis TaxID=1414722 RepID=UPI0008396FD3|nr:50S ribosomal protein L24 [Candidatus Protochlamydia phocaeensis]